MSSLKVAHTLTRYDESPIGLRTEMFEEHGGFLAAVDVVGAAAEEELDLLPRVAPQVLHRDLQRGVERGNRHGGRLQVEGAAHVHPAHPVRPVAGSDECYIKMRRIIIN